MNYNEILFLIIIVMQRNCTKHFPGGVHYPDAIFLMAIIWGYISVINIIQGAIILRGNCPGGQLSWGAIVRGAIIQGAIVLFPEISYLYRSIYQWNYMNLSNALML